MIDRFRGKYRSFSNFWIVKGGIVLTNDNGGLGDFMIYRSVEHAYQAAKTLNYADRFEIMNLNTAQEAKAHGNTIQLRPDWKSVRVPLMIDLVRQKFTNSLELKTLLLSTGEEELIEGNNWHDVYWGRCICNEHQNTGENWLGRILMQIRKELE